MAELAPVYRQRVRRLDASVLAPSPPKFRQRVKRFAPIVVPKRRGRAPAHIPDPWSDLEWEMHPAAQEAVRNHPYGMTLEEIGHVMSITRERVRQIENTALRKLAENSGNDTTWIRSLTIATPDCKRCGEPFVRTRGRQLFCDDCEATRRKRKPAAAWESTSTAIH